MDNSTVSFQRFHEHSPINELSFNISHRYVNMSNERSEEYLYILTHLRGEEENTSKSECLFVIPAFGTWVFMDCSKVFADVTFFCEYHIEKQKKFRELPDEVLRKYCNDGWTFFDYGHEYCYKLLGLKGNKYIAPAHLMNSCKRVRGSIASFQYYSSAFGSGIANLLELLFPLEMSRR